MELPGVVPPEPMRSEALRRLLHFFVLGAALAGAQHQLAPPPPGAPQAVRRELPVAGPPGADAGLRQRLIDEALLVEEAVRAGWPEHDRVVRDRLVRNIEFAQPDLPPERRLEVALALGMAQTDPVARARLADRAERELTQDVAVEMPTDVELQAVLDAQRERYLAPATVTFSQVFVDPQERGSRILEDAAALLTRLRADRPAPPTALGLGDALLIARPEETRPVEALDRTYGKGFGTALVGQPRGVWSGPVASTYGQHLVLVHEVQSARLRDLDEVRGAVTAQWRRARKDEALRRALDTLLAQVELVVVDGPSEVAP